MISFQRIRGFEYKQGQTEKYIWHITKQIYDI